MFDTIENRLNEAFCEIVLKDDRKLTVTNLCKKAEIARATFYIHYKSLDEYIDEIRKKLINKIIKEASILLFCDSDELRKNIKKENLLFSECELKILSYFTSNEKCIEFATYALKNIGEYLNEANIPEEFIRILFSGKHKGIETFIFGYIVTLYINLSDYDEKRMSEDIRKCRMLFNLLVIKNKNIT